MAQRRLFSAQIVQSDAFLDMPLSSQCLYFQLGMEADDDGFVNPKRTMRMLGASEDDLRVLLSKRFLLPFENGVVVVKHWLIHNTIRMDRYKPTMYVEEKKRLYIKENKSYTDDSAQGVPLLATKWQPSGNQMEPQVKLSKDKILSASDAPIVEVREDKKPPKPSRADSHVLEVFRLFGRYPKVWEANRTQRGAAERLHQEHGIEQIKKAIAFYREHSEEPYCPVVDTPWKLDNKWNDLHTFKEKNNL